MNVVPYDPHPNIPLADLDDPHDPHPNIPLADLNDEEFRFFTTTAAVKDYFISITKDLARLSGDECYYGLDTEFNRYSPKTSLLQVPFRGFPVLHLFAMKEVPEQLKAILQMEKFIAYGRSIGNDLARLEKLGVVVPQRLELGQIARTHDVNQCTGLAELSRRYCGLRLGSKEYGQDADYGVDELPTALIKYGAIDAMMSRMVSRELLRLTALTNLAMQEPPDSVRVGMAVDVMWCGKKRASGIVLTIGNERGRGEACKWGGHLAFSWCRQSACPS